MPSSSAASKPFKERRRQPLRTAAYISLSNYFADLDGNVPTNLYDMMMGEVEHALLQSVLEYTRGNQSKAAELLGLTRSTLRKKLRTHGLLD